MNIDEHIRIVAEDFASELQKLRMRGDRDNAYGEDKLELIITRNNGKTTFELNYARGYGNNVKASTLGKLMDEVYRREGFDEREQTRTDEMSRALVSLPAPVAGPTERLDDEIPY